MPESTADAPVADWTCSRCEVTVSWMAETERPALPSTWAEDSGQLYCLACRRERAGEAAVLRLKEGASAETRRQASSRARAEFEVKRRPESEDTRIANACSCSVAAVRKARVRLGLQSRRP
jgi:hypothetical protein